MSSKFTTRRLATDAILVALYALLAAFVSIKAGNLRITFASLPIVVCALLYGPADACIVAALGELMPPVVRALIIGLGAAAFSARGERLEKSLAKFYLICLAAALATTLANTAVLWLDSVILGYYSYEYVFASFLVRIFTGVVTAVIVSTIAVPVAAALRKAGFGRLCAEG